jgi:hypothetical protein
MFDHLKRRASRILASTETVTLSTSGPAGIQARLFRCETDGINLYLLLPNTSDHLLNLEQDPQTVASTAAWQLRGVAHIQPLQACPPGLLLPQLPQANNCVLVKIQPSQLHLYRQDGWGFQETIDFDTTS